MEPILANLERFAPVILRGPGFSDDEFLDFCAGHEELRVESNQNREIELMPGVAFAERPRRGVDGQDARMDG